MLARLKAARDAAARRGAAVVVVVLEPAGGGAPASASDAPAPLPADRVAGICSNLGLDAK